MRRTVANVVAFAALLGVGHELLAKESLVPVEGVGPPLSIDGKTAFASEAKAKKGAVTAVAVPGRKGAYELTGELRLPVAGASVAIATEDADGKFGSGYRVFLDKDGKTVRSTTRNDAGWPLVQVSDKIPVILLVQSGVVGIRVGDSRDSRDSTSPKSIQFTLSGGASLENLRVRSLPAAGNVPLAGWIESAYAVPNEIAAIPSGWVTSSGTLFHLAKGKALDVAASATGIKEPIRNKNFYVAGGPNRLVTQAPGDQYAALHMLAYAPGRPGHVPRTTLRIGHFGSGAGISEDVVIEFPDGEKPGTAQVVGRIPVKNADGTETTLLHLRVPLPQSANVAEFKRLDLELTRDMQAHTVPPDPNTFGKVPAGPPSDVIVLAATLEPSPITMAYQTDEPGNIWFDTQKSIFKTTLTNRSEKPQTVAVKATASGPGTGEEYGIERRTWTVANRVELKPGESKTVDLDVTPGKRGWFKLALAAEVDGRTVQAKDTTFAVLAPDTRKAFSDSPFGVWEFWRSHSVSRGEDQSERIASIMNKGGWRWTYGGSPAGGAKGEEGDEIVQKLRQKYKFTPTLGGLPQSYQRGEGWFNEAEMKANFPAAIARTMQTHDEYIKVMHESRSSTDLLRRYSEFLGGKPYDMPPAEKEKLEKQFENVKNYCLMVKKLNPKAKIVLFNDYPAVVFQFLQRKFPPEAFDAIGLEGAMFLRQPERQPDWLCVLAHHHEVKRAMKEYGYDKPVWTTEARYHPTAAGALSLHDQAVIAVRESMMDLSLGIQRMAAAGLLKDSADDYHWSNWGSAGFCFRDPEINPKPSYAMYAWLTQLLDQVKPAGYLAVPNRSLHVVSFRKPNGSHVYGVWCVSGLQRVTFRTTGGGTIVDAFGNPKPAAADPLTITISPTPIYITGTTLEAVTAAEPIEIKDDGGQVLLNFDDAKSIVVVPTASPLLEGNWDTPRLKGDFDVSFGTVDGATAAKIALKPDADPRKLLPRYVELALKDPITLPGRPEEFTVRVKGNAGWAKVMFEVKDAKGRIFTSCGNQYAGASNSQDPHGQAFVSFDGWQTIRFPLVGEYAGQDQSVGLPRNYNWWPTNTPEEKAVPDLVRKDEEAYAKALAAYQQEETSYQAALKVYETERKTNRKLAPPKKPTPPKKPVARRNYGIVPVDYPLTLNKVIVDMRPNILYLDEEVPVQDPAIWLDRLGVTTTPQQ